MIPLTRDRQRVPASLRGASRKKKNEELMAAAATGRISFQASYWKPAKRQLRAEAAGKCAYCEAATSVVAHGDVEHFRPKSVYWWLAYCYDNYLFACQICNQVYKGNEFPVRAARLPAARHAAGCGPDPSDERAVAAFLRQTQAEQADLPDPYVDDVESLFAWEADEALKEVRLVPRGARTARRAGAAEQLYGLNREELRRARFRIFTTLDVLRRSLAVMQGHPLEPAIRGELDRMSSPAAQFSGMVRYFRHRWGV
jgi:uncharacterized protein (TIGR02646 family)